MRLGGVLALIAFIIGALIATHGSRGLKWRTVEGGLEFAAIQGEPYCRRGPSQIGVLRIDPQRYQLRVRHFSQLGLSEPPDIIAWRERTDALAAFNAGQYYPDHAYMGLLVSDGEILSERLHPDFKAALVAEPVGRSTRSAATGERAARVLDLESDPLDTRSPEWREVAQSFMLFDRHGRVRVKKSDRIANRTVVAEDRRGRLLVITTEGGYTLWELAQLLREGPLEPTLAMCMDGGAEAKMVVKREAFAYASFGPWRGEEAPKVQDSVVPLPAVVTVHRR